MEHLARIRRIQVSKLFGIFDHDIPLNLNERITIIHGPNGYGKTVILQLLDGLFGQWEALSRVPFGEFVVEFENGGVIRVKQGGSLPVSLEVHRRWGPPPYHLESFYVEKPGAEPRPFIGPFLPPRAVRFIQTERLGSSALPSLPLTISRYSGQVATSIKSLLATYASRAQELDSTFLDRLLEESKGPPPPMAVLQERLNQIERKRTQLIALGFLDHDRETHKPPPRLDPSKLDVLSVYVDDTEKKLSVFDEMARKVQLLTDAINKRFTYKRMSTSKEKGFIFQSGVDAAPIPLTSLSSGEQHELVLFYELLFKTAPDTLVLIDEPEISLHLVWQRQFLGDLVEIVKLSNFDVLVATHAPAIIGKRWDLTVELKGPDLENAAE
jgi:ABC-type transport system involved in cytochrome c biogenesis ATPase subunit